jgi:hypothetical protein
MKRIVSLVVVIIVSHSIFSINLRKQITSARDMLSMMHSAINGSANSSSSGNLSINSDGTHNEAANTHGSIATLTSNGVNTRAESNLNSAGIFEGRGSLLSNSNGANTVAVGPNSGATSTLADTSSTTDLYNGSAVTGTRAGTNSGSSLGGLVTSTENTSNTALTKLNGDGVGRTAGRASGSTAVLNNAAASSNKNEVAADLNMNLGSGSIETSALNNSVSSLGGSSVSSTTNSSGSASLSGSGSASVSATNISSSSVDLKTFTSANKPAKVLDLTKPY